MSPPKWAVITFYYISHLSTTISCVLWRFFIFIGFCFVSLAVWKCYFEYYSFQGKHALTQITLFALPLICLSIIFCKCCIYMCRLIQVSFIIMYIFSCQCGFFKRSEHDDSVPRYHAVRIRKEAHRFKDRKAKLDSFEKKQWMTSWNEHENYS